MPESDITQGADDVRTNLSSRLDTLFAPWNVSNQRRRSKAHAALVSPIPEG
jgi:hypothetical protein